MHRTVPQRFAVFNQRLLRNILLGGLAIALVLGFALPSAVAQVDNNTVFELDGNPTANTVLDWSSPLGAFSGTAVPVTEAANTSIFTTGGSKDEQDISSWRHKDGSVPPKDDMLNAAAKIINLSPGRPAIVFAADRYSNNGDAQIGFWFVQQQLTLAPNGTFGPATHQDGDLLALANFSNGGSVATVQVYEWLSGAPVLISNASTAGKCNPAMTHSLACVITNEGTTAIPTAWPYSPKAGSPNTYPQQSFFEGAIDLMGIFRGAESVPCFSSFLVETRSSTSIDATLKDFVAGGFEACGVSVTKVCDGFTIVGGNMIQYNFSGVVTNEGSGTVYDVIVQDTAVAGDINVAASIAGGGSAAWSGSATVAALSLSNTATAKAASVDGGQLSVISEPAMATCSATVNGGISITKSCNPGTSLAVQGSVVVVQVGVSGQVCNEGNVALSGITLDNDPNATITFNAASLAPKGQAGECAPWSATYTPSTISSGTGVETGRYFFADDIKVTAASAALGGSLPGMAACPNSAVACASASCPICPPGSAACPLD